MDVQRRFLGGGDMYLVVKHEVNEKGRISLSTMWTSDFLFIIAPQGTFLDILIILPFPHEILKYAAYLFMYYMYICALYIKMRFYHLPQNQRGNIVPC